MLHYLIVLHPQTWLYDAAPRHTRPPPPKAHAAQFAQVGRTSARGIVSRSPLQFCHVSQVSHHVPLPTPLAKLKSVTVGMYKYCSVHTCQGLASQHGKASMYPTRAAILLVSFSGRANRGLCPATLDIRLRCGRTTPYSVQVVKTCMSHAARRFVYNAGRHRNPAPARGEPASPQPYTSMATAEDAISTSPAPDMQGLAFWSPRGLASSCSVPLGMGLSSPLIRKSDSIPISCRVPHGRLNNRGPSR